MEMGCQVKVETRNNPFKGSVTYDSEIKLTYRMTKDTTPEQFEGRK
jgi:hypothetical protein